MNQARKELLRRQIKEIEKELRRWPLQPQREKLLRESLARMRAELASILAEEAK